MVLRPVADFALLMLSSCAAVQNNATIALTGGVGDVSRAQAISNLGKMLDRKGFAPNAVTLTTGSVQTQQGVSAGANIPIGDQNTIGQPLLPVQPLAAQRRSFSRRRDLRLALPGSCRKPGPLPRSWTIWSWRGFERFMNSRPR